MKNFIICVRNPKLLFPCLTKHYTMKTYWGGGIAPRILNLGTRWN